MIIAVSDMYLPQAFLEEVLKEKGYTEISRVFVSNEENCCKGDGRLFQKVLEELNIGRGDIVHIGDNRVADKEAPEALGIRACHRVSDVERMLLNPAMAKYKLFVEGNPCLASSVLAGLYARRHANDVLSSPFTELGYYLGGPLAVGYCQYIHKVAKESQGKGQRHDPFRLEGWLRLASGLSENVPGRHSVLLHIRIPEVDLAQFH